MEFTEEWRQIRGFPDHFISNTGLVFSKISNRVLKSKIDRYGYEAISLSRLGKTKHFTIHRLVAKAFIPNPDNLPTVNHKDENKLNNNVYNLEWSTVKDNDNFGTRNIRMANSKKKSPIAQYDMTGKIVTIYPGIKDAQIITGINRNCIREVCKGTRKSAGGYKWSYYKEIQNE